MYEGKNGIPQAAEKSSPHLHLLSPPHAPPYSHSIVPGGFDVMS